MSVLGNLAVNLVANTKNFDKGLKKSKKQVSGFASVVKQAGPMIAGVFGTAAVKQFVSGQLVAVDALAKTSRQLGLSTEALGAYHHAAQLSGMSTDEMDNSLKKMQDTIGAAMQGEAGAIRAFDALGLSAEKIADAADPLALIQQRIEAIGNQNLKLSVVRDIFGRSGAGALNLFEQNLKGVADRYKELGLAVSSEEAKRIEDLNDAMFEMGEQWKGIGRRLLIDATPTLVRAVDGLNIAMEAIGILQPKGGKQKQTFLGDLGAAGEEFFAGLLTPLMMANEGGDVMGHYYNRMLNRIDSQPAGF